MNRPFYNLNPRRAGRQLAAGLSCAAILFGGCQESPQVARHAPDLGGGSSAPQRFHAPEDVRPMAQLASHLQISEADEHVVENPFAGLNRFPPVTDRAPVASLPQATRRETPAFDRLKLPFRLEKSAPPEKPAQLRPIQVAPRETEQPSRPAARGGLSPLDAPLQLNPPEQASPGSNQSPETAPESVSLEKRSTNPFLASLEPDAPSPRNQLALPAPPSSFGHGQPSKPVQVAPRGEAASSNDETSHDRPSDATKPEKRKADSPANNPALVQPSPQPTPATPPSSFVKFRAVDPQALSGLNGLAKSNPAEPRSNVSVLERSPGEPASIRPFAEHPPQLKPAAPQAPSAEDRALLAVRERMNSLVDRGLILAQRGAYFSARAEFIQALRLATQTLDTARSTHRHSEALAEAIAALEEAGDFIPSGSQLEANIDLELVISSHRTTVLHDADPRDLTALTAAQRYFALAQEKLAVACGGLPEASRALVGLGRIQEYLYDSTGDNRTLIGPRSIALYQSALVVHGKNFEAANELGVMLARYGQYEDAKQALLQGVEASSRPEIWRNLASIHQTLGEADLANRARLEAEHALQFAQAQNTLDAVRWVSPEEMADHGRGETGLKQSQPRRDASETPLAQKRPPTSWWSR